jgi:uncharacterized OsmC-like protein
MDLRAVQQPIKDAYRADPDQARITLTARGSAADAPVACSVDLGRAIYEAQAHTGVGGAGTAACSGDLLLGALAACAQLTCQMVATAMGLEVRSIETTVEGDLDLRGTLGLDREVGAGFTALRLRFAVDAPDASEEDLDGSAAQDRALLHGGADADGAACAGGGAEQHHRGEGVSGSRSARGRPRETGVRPNSRHAGVKAHTPSAQATGRRQRTTA